MCGKPLLISPLVAQMVEGADAMFESFSCLIQRGGLSIYESITAKSQHEQSVLTSQDVGRERSNQLSKGVRLCKRGGLSLIPGFIWLSWSGGGRVALWTLCLGGEGPRGGRVAVGQGWWSPPHLGGTCVRAERGKGVNIVCRGIKKCHLTESNWPILP